MFVKKHVIFVTVLVLEVYIYKYSSLQNPYINNVYSIARIQKIEKEVLKRKIKYSRTFGYIFGYL